MKDISQKIAHLSEQKAEIEKRLLELKKDNVQKLASILAAMQGVEKVDLHVLVGAVLDLLKKEDSEKEDLRKAGKMFCKQYRHHIETLSPSPSKDPKTSKKSKSSGDERKDDLSKSP